MNKRIIALFIAIVMIVGMVSSVSATSVTGELTIVNIDYSTRNETTPTVISTKIHTGDVGESWQDLTKETIQEFVYLSSNYSNSQENYEDYGKFEAGSHTLTQYYKPKGWVDPSDEEGKGFVGIHYEGDAYIADTTEIIYTETLSGNIGDSWSASPKEFDDWIYSRAYADWIVEPILGENGQVSGIFRATQPVNQYQHLTYVYIPAGRLTRKYIDIDTGEKIAEDSPTIKKAITKKISFSPKEIEGYTLLTELNDEGKISYQFPDEKGAHAFIFEYRKNKPTEGVPHTIEKILLDHLGNRIGDDSNYFTIQLEQLIDDEWIVIKTYELKGNEKIDAGILDIGTYRTSEINIPTGYTANNPNHTPFDITEESTNKSTSFTNVKDKPMEPEEPEEPEEPVEPVEPEEPYEPQPNRPRYGTFTIHKNILNNKENVSKEGFTFELWRYGRKVAGPLTTNSDGIIEIKSILYATYEIREILTEEQKLLFEENRDIEFTIDRMNREVTIDNVLKDKVIVPPVVEPEPELPPVIEPEPELPPVIEPEPELPPTVEPEPVPPVAVVPKPQPTLPKTGSASTVAMSSLGTLLLAGGLWLQRKKK